MKRTLNESQDGYLEILSLKEFKKEAIRFNEDWKRVYKQLFPTITVNLDTLEELNRLGHTYCNLGNYVETEKRNGHQRVLYRYLEPQTEKDKKKLMALWSLQYALCKLIETED